jgi:hypothetical protein
MRSLRIKVVNREQVRDLRNTLVRLLNKNGDRPFRMSGSGFSSRELSRLRDKGVIRKIDEKKQSVETEDYSRYYRGSMFMKNHRTGETIDEISDAVRGEVYTATNKRTVQGTYFIYQSNFANIQEFDQEVKEEIKRFYNEF